MLRGCRCPAEEPEKLIEEWMSLNHQCVALSKCSQTHHECQWRAWKNLLHACMRWMSNYHRNCGFGYGAKGYPTPDPKYGRRRLIKSIGISTSEKLGLNNLFLRLKPTHCPSQQSNWVPQNVPVISVNRCAYILHLQSTKIYQRTATTYFKVSRIIGRSDSLYSDSTFQSCGGACNIR